ncbi:TPA: CatB-related O-acetyltransferase [Escherichia coli]|uniref:Chloramphenicol acetyltransferase n=2 Tax=Escherichia TaxID=561 RepID=A0A0D3QU76_ECOLX|nr:MULTISPECIES: CatB-related O-acetyltransferase [Escherichia]AJR19386.1 chloramphenicol acetyltransferase [Escherichia coli]EEV6378076.1 CatB-related O-acetyltransferase [Escherichia coli]EEW0683125.1 antibiotic acetyltransferase [Escherichia coli]EEW2322661.1 antibiotic acetyltransferase [Escherichia coli]EEW6052829.1 antibiotic acetyltransferase [Escherichia coli]
MGLLSRIKSHLKKRKLNKSHLNIYVDVFSYIDESSTLDGCNRITGKSSIYDSHIGKYSYVAGASIGNATVGKFCSIAKGAKIGGLGAHPTTFISSHPIFYSTKKQCGVTFTSKDYFLENADTILGNDVWVGTNAIIMDGVTIGDGAIIGAGAIVTKDVPPYAIVVGVPAIIKRYRFPTEQIEILKKIKWWDWPEQDLKKNSFLFREDFNESICELAKLYNKVKRLD